MDILSAIYDGQNPIILSIFFGLGFFLLIQGGEWLVESAVQVAEKLKIPEIVIGLTIISCGTSLPELIINVLSSYNEASEIAIGNVYGSNISNILLILGISCIVSSIPVSKSTLRIELPVSIFAMVIVAIFANSNYFTDSPNLYLDRTEGIILLILFLAFLVYVYFGFKNSKSPIVNHDQAKRISLTKSLFLMFGGVVALSLGGDFTVQSAIGIAEAFTIPKELIGLTIIAVGSSLPELFTSIVAAKKNKASIVMGNIIGSNIFNLLWILGLSSTIYPIKYIENSNKHVYVVIIASLMIYLFRYLKSDRKLELKSGIFFLISYMGYILATLVYELGMR